MKERDGKMIERHKIACFDKYWKKRKELQKLFPNGELRFSSKLLLWWLKFRCVWAMEFQMLFPYDTKTCSIPERARGLSYSLLFVIVPYFTMIFIWAKGLNIGQHIKNSLIKYFPDSASKYIDSLVEAVNNNITNISDRGGFWIIAGLFLLVSLIFFLNQFERSINALWYVRRPRLLAEKCVNYLAFIILLFLFTFGTIEICASIKDSPLHWANGWWAAIQLFCFIVSIFCIYAIVPKAHKKRKYMLIPSALIGVLVWGLIWGVPHLSFSLLKSHLHNINVIYGTAAAIPVFLILSWLFFTFILIGCSISFYSQNFNDFAAEHLMKDISMKDKLGVMLFIQDIIRRNPNMDIYDLAIKSGIPYSLVKECVSEYERIGLIKKDDDIKNGIRIKQLHWTNKDIFELSQVLSYSNNHDMSVVGVLDNFMPFCEVKECQDTNNDTPYATAFRKFMTNYDKMSIQSIVRKIEVKLEQTNIDNTSLPQKREEEKGILVRISHKIKNFIHKIL